MLPFFGFLVKIADSVTAKMKSLGFCLRFPLVVRIFTKFSLCFPIQDEIFLFAKDRVLKIA